MTESEKLLKPLLSDVIKCKKAIKENDNQYNRRNFVRAIYVLFEASLNLMKDILKVLMLDKGLTEKDIEVSELVPLLDNEIKLKDNGKIKYHYNKYSFKNLTAYVFKTFAEYHGFEKNILGDHRWDSFQKFLKLRNRIVHPDTISDAKITDKELEKVYEAEDWWVENMAIFWELNK